ncbi:hypothetical protein D3C86_1156000 [compost metagenome]
MAVGDGIGDRRGRLFAGCQVLEDRTRVERIGTIGVKREGAAVGAGHGGADAGRAVVDLRDNQLVAVRIRVIGQHAAARGEVERGVLIGGAGVIDGGRAVVGARDRHDDRRGGGGAARVRDGVGDGAGGRLADGQVVVMATRREDVAAVGLDDERAAIGAGDADAAGSHGTAADRSDCQRIAVGVRVVAEQVAADQGVLVADACVVQRVGRIVDGGRRSHGGGIIVARQGSARDAGQSRVAARGVGVRQVQRAGGFKDAGQADKAAAAGFAAAGHHSGGGVHFIERVAAGLQGGQQAVGIRA